MNISGSTTLRAPRDAVWAALQDPAVLVATIPGCEQLRPVAADSYAMTLTAGIASIKGTYTGTVQLCDLNPPEAYVLRAAGAGAPGTVQATARVRLFEDDGATRLDYDAEAVVGGMIGGVGQRVIAGVARRTATEFFAAVDRYLTEGAPERAPAATPAEAPAAGAPTAYTRPAPAPTLSSRTADLLTGAGLALAGVLIGWLLGSRGAR